MFNKIGQMKQIHFWFVVIVRRSKIIINKPKNMKKLYIMMAALIITATATGAVVASVGGAPLNQGRHQAMLEQKAEMLGIDIATLQSKMDNGETLRDIFEELGITKEDFMEKKLNWKEQHIDALVARDKITTEEGNARLAEMRERMENCQHEFDGSGRTGKGVMRPFHNK